MAAGDIEMKPAAASGKEKKEKEEVKGKEEVKPKVPVVTPFDEIKTNILLIERAVSTLEPRFTHRVLRSFTSLRKKLDWIILRNVIDTVVPSASSAKSTLLSYFPAVDAPTSMEIDTNVPKDTSVPKDTPLKVTFEFFPETEVYLRLLIIYHLLSVEELRPKSMELVHETVSKIQAWNRRSMDSLGARVYIALGRVYDLVPGAESAEIRATLLAAQRTASLRQDDETLAALINLLLRNYLNYNLYSQADKLVAKVTFPENAGNAQLARYLYYVGRIRAVQLSYTDAHGHLETAIRRAPAASTAPGFYQAAHKFFVVTELLMGDIPKRSLFRHPVLEKALSGYFEIVKAVRLGSLAQFQSTLATHAAQFTEDKTYTLILRLRQNVIKTGIRQLSLSYSRISLRDICYKLHLDSEEDAEYIVGKAIRDGVIEGRVMHKEGWMECGGGKGGYGTEVSDAFGKRITFCLGLHNESVKAMRYPLNAHRKELAAAEGAREREKELAKEIADGELDGDDDIGGF